MRFSIRGVQYYGGRANLAALLSYSFVSLGLNNFLNLETLILLVTEKIELMLSFMVRLFIVCISFILSAALCATVFFILKKQALGVDPFVLDPQVFLYGVGNLLLDGLKIIPKYGVLTVLGPVFAMIVIGFLLRIRTLFYYVPAGGLALLAMPVLMHYSQTTVYQQPDETNIFLYMVSGSAAGLFYWLIGGANAVPKRGTSFF